MAARRCPDPTKRTLRRYDRDGLPRLPARVARGPRAAVDELTPQLRREPAQLALCEPVLVLLDQQPEVAFEDQIDLLLASVAMDALANWEDTTDQIGLQWDDFDKLTF